MQHGDDSTSVRHLDLVESLDDDAISLLFGGLTVATVEGGTQFVPPPEPLHCALVRTGRLALDYDGAPDRHRTVTLVEEGDVLIQPTAGDLGAGFALRALNDSTLILVTPERFSQWIAHEAFAAALIRQLSSQVLDREMAAATALEPRVEHRLLMKVRQLAHRFGRATPQGLRLDLRLTHQQLADMVGAVRETVTIALGRLAANGDLVIQNRTIWVPYDPPADREESLSEQTA